MSRDASQLVVPKVRRDEVVSQMNRVVGSRRQGKRAGSLDDSASDSGKILSYQRMPQDSPIKGIPADGTAELSSQPMPVSARLKHRVKTIPEPSHRSTTATSRVETALSSETSRSRLSTANLEQNHHAYRNHPQSLDYQDRTRQWLKYDKFAWEHALLVALHCVDEIFVY
ncbi:hypothetical protein WJX82_011072 [Trebouxia sp. C0006]